MRVPYFDGCFRMFAISTSNGTHVHMSGNRVFMIKPLASIRDSNSVNQRVVLRNPVNKAGRMFYGKSYRWIAVTIVRRWAGTSTSRLLILFTGINTFFYLLYV